MKSLKALLSLFIALTIFSGKVFSQDSQPHRCGTMEHFEYMKKKDPTLEARMQADELKIQKWIDDHQNMRQSAVVDFLPVVVHVLYSNSLQNISDQAILNTIQALNEDYGRTAPDTNLTPAVWKPIAASTNIQFCLAQRDPNGAVTNGIQRRQTSAGPFDTDDLCKFNNTGGLDAWDVTRYFNIWICDLVPGLGGYGEFPQSSFSNTFGNVTDYTLVGLNGWVASHECGHCFNLRHIWGDDAGACFGSDNVSDTPNQADATNSPCPTFPALDACATTSPGYMFMNYMDYGSEACKNIFTVGQSNRAHSALYNLAMSALLTSDGCQQVFSVNDAGVSSVSAPAAIICDTFFDPIVELKNFGTGTLSSAVINYSIDAGSAGTFPWSGTLASLATTNVTLPTVTAANGLHTMKVYATLPNGVADPNPYDDTTTYIFSIATIGQNAPIVQGFQNPAFPVSGWSLANSDNGKTWTRVVPKHGTPYSVAMENYTYPSIGEVDDLIVPNVNLISPGNVPVFTFWVAYAYQTVAASDTLEVLISTDCGASWTSMYKKWGDSLSTAAPTTSPFEPVSGSTSPDWRLEAIDLTPFTFSDNAIIKFRNINSNQNNLYIDDVNISFLVGIKETLDGNIVSIYPNPTTGKLTVNTITLKSQSLKITVSDAVGKTMLEKTVALPSHETSFDLSAFSNGVYFIRLDDGNATATGKFLLNK